MRIALAIAAFLLIVTATVTTDVNLAAVGTCCQSRNARGVMIPRYSFEMAMRRRSSDPEIWCDFNARMTERGYLPTNGTTSMDPWRWSNLR